MRQLYSSCNIRYKRLRARKAPRFSDKLRAKHLAQGRLMVQQVAAYLDDGMTPVFLDETCFSANTYNNAAWSLPGGCIEVPLLPTHQYK